MKYLAIANLSLVQETNIISIILILGVGLESLYIKNMNMNCQMLIRQLDQMCTNLFGLRHADSKCLVRGSS